jgi:peroxiredoxin Q/BCP
VSFDTDAENAAFSDKFSFNFPLLCDTDRKLGLAYGACDSAQAGSAKRVGVVIGPDGRVREYSPSVNAGSYPSEVLARL